MVSINPFGVKIPKGFLYVLIGKIELQNYLIYSIINNSFSEGEVYTNSSIGSITV